MGIWESLMVINIKIDVLSEFSPFFLIIRAVSLVIPYRMLCSETNPNVLLLLNSNFSFNKLVAGYDYRYYPFPLNVIYCSASISPVLLVTRFQSNRVFNFLSSVSNLFTCNLDIILTVPFSNKQATTIECIPFATAILHINQPI